MTAFRLLVTGGRERTDGGFIRAQLDDAAHRAEICGATSLVVVHGANPSGADRVARDWARGNYHPLPVREEPHPAAWGTHGRAAGAIRNKEMVTAGAVECLAFPDAASVGTYDCVKKARAAGVPTLVHRLLTDPPRRLRRSRGRGARMPASAVYVGRLARGPGRWGNPFVAGETHPTAGHVLDREQAVKLHEAWLTRTPVNIRAARTELQGLDLACWCPLPGWGEPDVCHAATLLRLANSADLHAQPATP